ncbi:MAG TPA: metallophosphoesterase, partial [bacterium]|nr:metallophosphoesterase [bacterium]
LITDLRSMARYAITDIHGCAATFRALLHEGLQLTTRDELYLLGDYLNKGPDSRGVLDEILDLRRRGYQVVTLRGNHDQQLLEAMEEPDDEDLLRRWQDKLEWAVTLDSFGVGEPHHVQDRYLKLLDSLEWYVELEDYVLVHAGLNFKDPEKMWKDRDAMLNLRGYDVEPALLGGRPLVHGHVPQRLVEVRRALKSPSPKEIGLDTGCCYYKNVSFGNLVALNLDTRALTVQPNIDRPYPIARK